MSDLISREEVLDLLDTAFESGAFDGRYAYENLIDAVQNLIHPLETDLVSRQAVIDTIETDCSWDIFNEWGSRTPTGECIIEAIKRVPSVELEKCGDCISRQAIESALYNLGLGDEENGGVEYKCALADVKAELKNIPSVEPESKIGRWIEHEWAEELDGEGYLISNFECDKCHAWAGADYDYCPNCGAKMEVDA